jgi:aminoglycoside 6'-N-acetyltransferase I
MDTAEQLEIRDTVASDLEALASLFVECFSTAPWKEPWTRAAAAHRLHLFASSPTFRGAIALEAGQAVAMAMGQVEGWLEGNLFLLQEMCVSPSRQRSGVGTRILEYLLARVSRSDQVRSSYLLTDALSTAESFYLRRGFRQSDAKIVLSCGLKRWPMRGVSNREVR